MMASFKPAGLEDSDDSFDDFLLDDENDDLIEVGLNISIMFLMLIKNLCICISTALHSLWSQA